MGAMKLSVNVRSVNYEAAGNSLAGLTARETEVAHWLSSGKTNREIAILVRASPRTIDKHVEHILAKLHVENRTTAAVILNAKCVLFLNPKRSKRTTRAYRR